MSCSEQEQQISIWDIEDHGVIRRQRREDESDEAYREAFDEIDDQLRAEWAEQFDSIPYKRDGNEIHRLVMKRLQDD